MGNPLNPEVNYVRSYAVKASVSLDQSGVFLFFFISLKKHLERSPSLLKCDELTTNLRVVNGAHLPLEIRGGP